MTGYKINDVTEIFKVICAPVTERSWCLGGLRQKTSPKVIFQCFTKTNSPRFESQLVVVVVVVVNVRTVAETSCRRCQLLLFPVKYVIIILD